MNSAEHSLPLAIRVIEDEHRSLRAMLQSLGMLLRMGPEDDPSSFFDSARAMLFYIAEIPERQHHPTESRILFPKVLQRVPALAGVLAQLDREHLAGEAEVLHLQQRLLAWELMGPTYRAEFEASWLRYQGFYEAHLQLEESDVLPAARQCLDPTDWHAVDAEFALHRDPFCRAGEGSWHAADPGYQRLFSRIVAFAPPPIGLGGARFSLPVR